MKSGLFIIASAIFITSLTIYYIKNNKTINIKIKKISKYKNFFYFAIVLVSLVFFYKTGKNVINNFDIYFESEKNNIFFESCDEKVKEENYFYKSVIKQNYDDNFKNPYIPAGFIHVEGEWDTGFVIQDSNLNEYVWIPCTNKDNFEVPLLAKRYFVKSPFISKDYCYDVEYEDFILSALQNGGFYISRYEIGNEDENPVSKKKVKVWNNITPMEAIKISNNIYDIENINTELMNGYAYDTTLEWIIELNGNNIISNVEAGEEYYTGRSTPFNNIFDMNDNILEITQEKNYDTFISRGFYDNTSLKNNDYVMEEMENRFSMLENESLNYVGFRIVLYSK